MLARTHTAGPSVLHVRADDVLSDHLDDGVMAALKQNDAELISGPLVVVDETKSRLESCR